MRLCRASSSMPLLAPMVNIDGVPYLDGGLADSIPIERALEKENDKIVLILTRVTIQRNYIYNRQMNLIEKLEEEGKIFVLRPLIPTVSRLEKNYDALMHFYEHGYRLMKKQYDELMKYLEG